MFRLFYYLIYRLCYLLRHKQVWLPSKIGHYLHFANIL